MFISVMSHLSNISKELPADGLKHKHARKSPRLQEKYKQKNQVDNLLTDSHPDPTEPLDVGLDTSIAHSTFLQLYKEM